MVSLGLLEKGYKYFNLDGALHVPKILRQPSAGGKTEIA
jgi:hypothetical protein